MSDNIKNNHISVPIWLKTTLTIREAAEYSNIGINKIENLINGPNCDFVLYAGRKRLIKRKQFEQFIERHLEI
ncbi:MAG: excisionase family DNA-binding protein [Lachnospiraceae bacterium]|nr:excisionase family DNA-binding protein [Lachnospiraceae bacterium]